MVRPIDPPALNAPPEAVVSEPKEREMFPEAEIGPPVVKLVPLKVISPAVVVRFVPVLRFAPVKEIFPTELNVIPV